MYEEANNRPRQLCCSSSGPAWDLQVRILSACYPVCLYHLAALLAATIGQPGDRQVRTPSHLHSFFAELREICVTTRDVASG